MKEKRKRIMVIDYNNFAFLSMFGEELLNKHGDNVSAVKTFFFKLRILLYAVYPDEIVFAGDFARSTTFRRIICPNYKAKRKASDEAVTKQLSYIKMILHYMGYTVLMHETYEADDLIGMIAKYNAEQGNDTIIVSGDKDMYQLLNEHTIIYAPREKQYIDERYVMQKFGLTPQQWIELKILQGDRSDNVIGVPGIGEIAASRLMKDYGSIENIYNNLDTMPPHVAKRLIDGAYSLNISRILVTIVTNYHNISLTDDTLKRGLVQYDEALSIIDDLGVPAIIGVIKNTLMTAS